MFARFAYKSTSKEEINKNIECSIVICGKNEASNFAANLPAILEQQHHIFEVIVVDDHSSDKTQEILADLAKLYPNLVIIKPIQVPDKPGKKAALAIGISIAKYENILVTDADCKPASKTWVSRMVQPLAQGNSLVLGFSPYLRQINFLNKIVAWETYLTALQYGGFAVSGLPYMGVGRNMAYKKSFFVSPKIGELASGDDDLLVNKEAKAKETAIVFHEDSLTYSHAPENWRDWYKQKLRHYTAGTYYKPLHIVLLNLFSISMILCNVLCIALLYTSFWKFTLLLYLLTLIIKNLIHLTALPKMKSSHLAFLTIPLEIIWSILLPVLTLFSQFRNKTKWN